MHEVTALHLFRLFNVEDVCIYMHAHRWRLGDQLCAHVLSMQTSPRRSLAVTLHHNAGSGPSFESVGIVECSLISGRVIIDVLSKVEAPPACHHPQLGLKNHTHVLGFSSIACTHTFLHGNQVYTFAFHL